jgi:hypothetical protein
LQQLSRRAGRARLWHLVVGRPSIARARSPYGCSGA